ncbi:hypothetical protein AMECASPLE_013406 [Ameca splendens]|uniref:Uncharacterized protein n=1 Tax=Ameca splendens TaxID=208324 RepID=A0ABV0ZA70_9TELE
MKEYFYFLFFKMSPPPQTHTPPPTSLCSSFSFRLYVLASYLLSFLGPFLSPFLPYVLPSFFLSYLPLFFPYPPSRPCLVPFLPCLFLLSFLRCCLFFSCIFKA